MKKLLLTASLLCGLAMAQTTSTTPATTTPATATPAPTTPATPAVTPAPTPAPATPAPVTPAPAPAAAANPALPSPVVAKIGSETVTLTQFELAFREAVARLVNQQGMPLTEEIYQQFAGAKADFLKQYVRDRALAQLARGSAKPDAAATDAQLKAVRDRFKTEDEFKQALAQTGYAEEAALRAAIETRNINNTYLTNLQKKFTFGDATVSGYYNLHRAAFNRPAQACAKHILVATEAEAKDLAAQLAGGADFAKLAQEKSKDPGSGAQGGDLGCFGPGQMVPSFDRASFEGPLNTVQTVQSQFGWHLVVVTKRNAAGLMPLEEAAPLIRQQLSQDAAQKYLDAQIARIKVETFPDVLGAPKK